MGDAKLVSRAFALAFAANFMHGLALFAYLHLPGLLVDLGADELMVGLVFGTAAASAIVFRPIIGRLTDRRGRHVVAWIGSAIHIGVTLAYQAVDGIGPLLFGIRILHGVASGMLAACLFTIAADVVPASRRTEGMGIFGVSGMLPLALAGVAGDFILAHADYSTLFFATTVAAALGGLCTMGLGDSRPPAGLGDRSRSFIATIAQRPLRPIWLMGLSFSVAIASFLTFLEIFVDSTGIGSMGLFYSVYSAIAILLRLTVGWLPDRYGPRRVLAISLACLAAGLVLLATAGSDTGIALAGLACGTGHAFAFPILSALVVDRAAAGERGTALSMFTALFDLGLLIGAPMFGAVLEQTDYSTMFGTAAGLVVVGGILYLLWDRRVVPGVSAPSQP